MLAQSSPILAALLSVPQRFISTSGNGKAKDEPGGASRLVRNMCYAMVFLCRLEISVLTLVLPLMAKEFEQSLEIAAWINFCPMFTGLMFSPAIATFSDMYGHVAVWRAGVLMMVISTWLCGWSPSFPVLLAARALCGLSNGFIFAPAVPLMTRGAPPERRGVVQSAISSFDALGSSIGVLVGGQAVMYVNWRWIFLGPAPFMTILWFASWVILPPEAPEKDSSKPVKSLSAQLGTFDWTGTAMFAFGSFLFVLAINRGNELGWASPQIAMMFGGSLVFFVLLGIAENSASRPIFPVWLFFKGSMGLLTLTNVLSWSCYTATFLLFPIFLQEARGMTSGQIGSVLVPRPIGACLIAGVMAGMIDKKVIGMRALSRIGAAIQLLAYSVLNYLSRLPIETEFYVLLECQLLLQPLGNFMTALPTNAMFAASVDEKVLASVGAMMQTAVNLMNLAMQAIGLSIVKANGSEKDPTSYYPVWTMLCVIQVGTQLSTRAVPVSAELGFQEAPTPKRRRMSQGRRPSVEVDFSAGWGDDKEVAARETSSDDTPYLLLE